MAPHFQQVYDEGERCDLFMEARNPRGLMRKWSRGFSTGTSPDKHPDTLAARASHRFANYGDEDDHSDKVLYAKLKEANMGWTVKAPHGEGSIQARLFYTKISGAKMLRSYAHFKGW